ncbi:peptidoglycan recognition protein family protein [Lysinibacillus pakistanensis]|uniref:N-acetylmuramoyl-L-alanine amidase n=1 Tax=Lysinibacillus pakistanensis TaxID=759811 RepID=A0AAX3X3V0_9BACI|nr:N-acetylmuramoyl-L-alanine amidase [Lysinibacillus pakistanensis]MDM5233595.1 N-acetylmuramoyl-L-alanine amidase [Lysinibacillus pakistanensis]WHY49059.1 N-acetylmuramoyl-L-alanine amidase [Lysinibacillus pakistanensis]WHY54072.1 N-acetylmuramoyl-L-alanine amidase [Lysinibacillus pakistanensis]
MVTIRRKLVPISLALTMTNGKNNFKKYIVVHETDNTNIGADADAHARLQINDNSRQASWHWQVDDQEAVQSFEHFWECWGAGTYIGNHQGIQVEICVNSDGDYVKAVQNAATLIAKIIKDENIAIENIVQHHYFSGKNCPRNMRAGKVPWSQFIEMIKKASNTQNPPVETLKYRILTGTYNTFQAAESAAKVMKFTFGWLVYIEQDGPKYRIKTGTFTGMIAVKNAENKIKKAKLAQVTYIKDA